MKEKEKMKMNNNLIKMQEMLMRQMERLDDSEQMKYNGKDEVARGNALSQNANTFLKSVNVGMRVVEMADKYEMQKDKLTKELGITNEDE